MMEHEFEPVLGLPEPLPKGERILWQGRPDWKSLALRGYQVRSVAIYFALLMIWRLWVAVDEGATLAQTGAALMPLAILGVGALSILTLLAWLCARSAMFTVTSKRVVIRCGVALPMAINVPFGKIGAAGMKVHSDGTGDLPVAIQGDSRVSYILMWPFVRPWRLGNPEPMLRAVPDAARVGEILAGALKSATAQTAEQPDAMIVEAISAPAPVTTKSPVAARAPQMTPMMGSARA